MISVVIESTRLSARSARDAVRVLTRYADGEQSHIEVSSVEEHAEVVKAIEEKVSRDLGGPMLF